MFNLRSTGTFKQTRDRLQRLSNMSIFKNLNAHGRIGVDALSRATPLDNVAILIQYGHGTGTGGYVAGVDYINPTIKPIFDNIVNEIRKQVT
jgi:hypothetical protein